MEIEWYTAECVPAVSKILDLDAHSITVDSEHPRLGDVVGVATNDYLGIIRNQSLYWHEYPSTPDEAMGGATTPKLIYNKLEVESWCDPRDTPRRTVRYIDREQTESHECRIGCCEFDGSVEYHDYSNDYRMLALPFYQVRFAHPGDELLLIGPAYAESAKLVGE